MKVSGITAKTQNITGQKSFTKACPSSSARYCLVIMLGMAKWNRTWARAHSRQCVGFQCAKSLTLTLWRQSNVLLGKPLTDFGCSSGGVVRRFFVCGLWCN